MEPTAYIWNVVMSSGPLLKSCQPKIVSEYDQEIPQSQTADNPVASRGRAPFGPNGPHLTYTHVFGMWPRPYMTEKLLTGT